MTTDEKAPAPKAKTAEEKAADLAAATLMGDIRDFMLDRIKTQKKPWVAMTEDEQRDEIYAAKTAADRLVREVVHIISAQGRKVITGVLDQVTVKKEVKAVVTFPKTDQARHELIDSQGSHVLIVVAGTEEFSGEKAPAKPDPNQGDLIANAEKLKKKNDNVKPIK